MSGPSVLETDGVDVIAAPREARGVRFAGALGVQGAGRALRDFIAYLPTQLIPAIAGFLALPLIARRLAPTELGVLTIAQTLVSLGWIASAQWLTSAMMREYPAHLEQGTVPAFRRALARGMGVTGLAFGAFALAVAVGGFLSDAIAENALLIVAAAIGLVVQNIAGTLFAASLRPRAFAAAELLARTGGIVLGVKLVFDGHGIHGYLFGLAVASLGVGIVGLAVGWPRGRAAPEKAGSAPQLRSWIEFGAPVAISAFVIWALFFVDRYLLAVLQTTGDVGVYTVGSVIGDKSVMIPALAFYMATRPLLVTAFERDGRAEVERLMHEYTRVLILISLPIVGFVLIASDELVPLLATGFYATYYEPAADVAPIVAVGTFLYVLALVANTGLVVAKRSRRILVGAGAALLANIVANLVLIPPFGIVGAGIATIVGMGVFLLATLVSSRPFATWHFPLATFVRGLVATLVGVGAALALGRLANRDVTELLVSAGGGLAVYAAALVVLGELPPRSRRASA